MSRTKRVRHTRWESLLEQAERLGSDGSGAALRLERRLRRAIAEVSAALRGAPGDAGLHLLLVRLHLAGSDELALSSRVVRHLRWAALSAHDDPAVLARAGDLLAFRGLLGNHVGLWREGVSLQRRANLLRRARRVA